VTTDPLLPLTTEPTEPEPQRVSAEAATAITLGLLVCATVMAAAGELASAPDVAVTVAVSVFVYWLAESYALAIGHYLAARHRGWSALGHELRVHSPIVGITCLPLAGLLLAWIAGASDAIAVDTGLGVDTALLFLLGWLAATQAGFRGWSRAGAAIAITTLGGLMIVLKTYLHSPSQH
jgi:hypothetical protein